MRYAVEFLNAGVEFGQQVGYLVEHVAQDGGAVVAQVQLRGPLAGFVAALGRHQLSRLSESRCRQGILLSAPLGAQQYWRGWAPQLVHGRLMAPATA
ncbi:Uncharacterised protein [Mycobacteroides abscessus subsp. abscessus]|nr:Uncharacterised protein [Mycobacteroides abscessus subsp. abscessus]